MKCFYVVLELISKIKYAVYKFDIEPHVSATEVALLVVFGGGGGFCEVGFIDSTEVSHLTNCIFKFLSNTTLRLVLYLCLQFL